MWQWDEPCCCRIRLCCCRRCCAPICLLLQTAGASFQAGCCSLKPGPQCVSLQAGSADQLARMHPFALLAAMERDIPNYPNKYDVKSYGARGDGSGGARCG